MTLVLMDSLGVVKLNLTVRRNLLILLLSILFGFLATVAIGCILPKPINALVLLPPGVTSFPGSYRIYYGYPFLAWETVEWGPTSWVAGSPYTLTVTYDGVNFIVDMALWIFLLSMPITLRIIDMLDRGTEITSRASSLEVHAQRS